MKNRTFVVAIDPNMDNFSVLGLRHTLKNGNDVVVHNDPAMNMQGAETVFNFDVYISGKRGFDPILVSAPRHRLIVVPRHTKSVQAALLQKAVADFDGTPQHGFRHVPTWINGWGGRNYPCSTDRMVVKPGDGARGIGQFTVSTQNVNMDYFLKQLNKLVEGEHTQEKLDEFLSQFNGNVKYHTGSENFPLEGLGALKEDEIVVQEVIENIVKEYRVITDKNSRPAYWQERRRPVGQNFPQATGGGAIIDHNALIMLVDIPSCINVALLEHLCRNVIGPLSSIDLFVTGDGSWGIFEYCNQFGISGVPQDVAFNLHAEFMQDIVDIYIEGEERRKLVADEAGMSSDA